MPEENRMSIDDLNDASDKLLDEFYVEPWTVAVRSESLTLADRTPRSEYLLSACVPIVIGVVIILVAMRWGRDWSWEARLLGYVMAGLIATGAFPLIAKGLGRPQSYRLDRRSRSVWRNRERLGSWSEIEAVEIAITYYVIGQNDLNRQSPMSRKHQNEHRLQLRIGARRFVLVTSGSITPAERLGQSLADFVEVPLTRS